jgi:hypothetical protein
MNEKHAHDEITRCDAFQKQNVIVPFKWRSNLCPNNSPKISPDVPITICLVMADGFNRYHQTMKFGANGTRRRVQLVWIDIFVYLNVPCLFITSKAMHINKEKAKFGQLRRQVSLNKISNVG